MAIFAGSPAVRLARVHLSWCMCVCVCMREREREKKNTNPLHRGSRTPIYGTDSKRKSAVDLFIGNSKDTRTLCSQ